MKPQGIDDRYEVIMTLQEKAATAVMLVRHKQIEEVRILKAIHKSQPDAESILSEANLLAGIKSPGIPTIFDVGQTNDWYYLIEEYIEGQSLQEQFVDNKKLSKEEVINIAIQICEIIEVLHTAGSEPVLYRDMKPEHVIICEDKVKIIDFGISVKKSKANTAIEKGSKTWAAPEQIRGEDLDERCDVYGVGKVLEEMIVHCDSYNVFKFKKIASRATNEDRNHRFSSIIGLKKELEKLKEGSSYEKLEKGHLKKEIAVVGNGKSVGCTHVAIKVCEYLNKNNIDSYYMDKSGDSNVKRLSRNLKSYNLQKGVLYHNTFNGIVDYGPAVEQIEPPEGIKVIDYGCCWDGARDAELIIYVISTRPWQMEQIDYSMFKDRNVIVILNFASKIKAIEVARTIQEKVYIFPFSTSVFDISKKEEKIFDAILKKGKRICLE